MTSRLVCLLLLAASASAIPLTPHENYELQQSCGRDGRYRHKVLNGEGHLDYPFAAVTTVANEGVLSATVISPRHVLLFNVFEVHDDRVFLFNDTEIPRNSDVFTTVGKCVEEDWVLPEATNDHFQIKFAIDQFGAQAVSKVARVVVIDGCVDLTTYNPMVLELAQDLTFDRTHGAICLPRTDEEYAVDPYARAHENPEFTVFGMGPKGQALTSAKYNKKESCDKDFRFGSHVFCATPVNETQGLCQGDFGGGAITINYGRNTLIGVFAEGNTDCKIAPEYHQDPEFIDVAKHTKGICRQTGVCPDLEYEEWHTSTEGPYVPAWTVEPSTEEPTTEIPESANTVETIIAETFEKMLLNCSASEHKKEEPEEIHIHIHLDKDAKVTFD